MDSHTLREPSSLPLTAVRKSEKQRLLRDRSREFVQCRHLRLRKRGELARNLHILFKLRDVVATDNHRAHRMREREAHRVAHGHYTAARRNRRAFPRMLLLFERWRS